MLARPVCLLPDFTVNICRTHSFDESLPRLGKKTNSGRRVSWHSGLDTATRQSQHQVEMSVSPIVIISCPPSSPPPPPPPASLPSVPRSQSFSKERRSHSVTRNFRKIFNK